MNELIKQIGSYKIFNYLLPGVLYLTIVTASTSYDLIQFDPVYMAFICYFIGMVISRVGSLLIETTLIKLKFIKFKPYREYVAASKNDKTLSALSEQNNTYRTILSTILFIGLTIAFERIWLTSIFIRQNSTILILILLFTLFCFSYRKQTKYVYARVEENTTK